MDMKMNPIKAIETHYNGYRFRSRLEARWAVFFDTLGIPYEYEKEGYDLDGTKYLPDFWLPEQDCWIEIKGEEPTAAEREKALRLAQLSGHCVYVFEGSFHIPNPDQGVYPITANAYFPRHESADHGQLSPAMSWCHCSGCGRWVIKHNALAYDLRTRYWVPGYCEESGVCETWCPVLYEQDRERESHGITLPPRHSVLWFEAPNLIAAYTAARQARFEHGENGR